MKTFNFVLTTLCFSFLLYGSEPTIWTFSGGRLSQEWPGQIMPAGWHGKKRLDRINKLQKLDDNKIYLNGMIISDRFPLPQEKKVKVTLKTGKIGKFLKVYLFQYFNRNDEYFIQCAEAFDLKAGQEGTFVTSFNIAWQNQKFASLAIDGNDAEIRSISMTPVNEGKVAELKQNIIPVIFNENAPTVDGVYRPEEWKNSFSLKNPFLSLSHKTTFLEDETVFLQSDGKNLYILLRSPIAKSGNVKKDDGEVYRDDSFELILGPCDQPRNYHIVINFNGFVFDEERAVGQNFISWDCPDLKKSISKDGKYTNVMLSIPLSSVSLDPKKDWMINLCRNLPEYSDSFAAMNIGGYFNNMPKAYLCKNLKSFHAEIDKQDNKFVFRAKAEADSAQKLKFNVTENGGCNASRTVILDKPQTIEIAAGEIPEKAFEIRLDDQTGKQLFRSNVGFGNTESRVIEKSQKHSKLLYYPLQKKIAVVMNDLTFQQQRNIGKIVCKVGDTELQLPEATPYGSSAFSQIPFTVPHDGNFNWNVKIFNRNGSLFESVSGEFTTRKEFPWAGNKIGKERIVIPPFTDMTVSGSSIHCALREYKFGETGFPASIIAAGKEVLAAPVALKILTIDNQVLTFKGTRFKITEQAADRVEFESDIECGVIRGKLKAWMEYDGVLFYSMTLDSPQEVQVKRLYLEVSYADAKLFHVGANNFRQEKPFWYTANLKGENVIWKSNNMSLTKELYTSFLPTVWLGSFYNGLCFFAESDQGWINSRRSACYELYRKKNIINLHVNFVSKKSILKGKRSIEFGFVANPFKKLPGAGAEQRICWISSFAQTFFNLGLYAKDPYISSLMIEPKSKRSFLPYTCGNEYMDGDPEFYLVRNEFNRSAFEDKFNGWSSSAYKYRVCGNDANAYSSRCVLWNSLRVDFMLWRMQQLMKELPVDGIYLDNSYPTFSSNPLTVEQGFLREDGNWQGKFNLLSQREYLKRVATLAHIYKKRFPHISVHNTGCMLPPCFTFADVFFDGEMDVVKYYDTFTRPWNDIMLGVNWGIYPGRLTMLRKEQRGQSHALLSVFKLYDMKIWHTHSGLDQELVKKLNDAEVIFGTNAADSRFYGFWQEENPAKLTGSSSLLASCFQRGNELLVYISNPTANVEKASLPFAAHSKVTDVVTGKEVIFPVTVESYNFRALRIKQQ